MFRSTTLTILVVTLLAVLAPLAYAQTPTAPITSTVPLTGTTGLGGAPCNGAVAVKPDKNYTIGFIVKTLDNPYWVTLQQYGIQTGKLLGVNVEAYSAGGESQISNEVRIMEDLIAKKVNAIVVAPVDSNGIIPAIKEANAARIPVFTVDTAAYGGNIDSFIATDNIKGAELAGQFVVDYFKGQPANIGILEGISGQQTARDRLTGFHNIIDKHSNIKVVSSQPANWDKATALNVTENMLTANPKLQLIYASNDIMALGAVAALQSLKRTDVKVVGFDGQPEAIQAIEKDQMLATVKQYPEKMGVLGISEAVLALNGSKLPSVIDTGTALITKDNAQQFLTKAPSVQELMACAITSRVASTK